MLPYYGYRVAEGVVRFIPHRAAHALGSAVAGVLLAVTPGRFEGLRSNLRQVLPGADERTIRRVARRNVRGLAHSWVNVLEMRRRPERILRGLSIEGLENFTEVLARGHGAVMTSMHFGAWETGLAMWNDLGHPMALLAEELRPRALFDRIVGARGSRGVQVIPLDVTAIRGDDPDAARRAGMVAMREVFRLLRSGVPVAIAIDRDLVGGGTPMAFFGKDASIPLGVVELAMRSGAAIIPTAILPTKQGVEARVFPEVVYEAQAPREAEVRRVTGVLLTLWEDLIRDHPHLWHVLDPIWDRPRDPRRGA